MTRDDRPTWYFYSVPCPRCQALRMEHCRTTGGNWVEPHSERVQRVRRIDEYKADHEES